MMYYSYNRILSYNAFLNFLIGERGVGKTYGAIKFVTKEFLKKGHQFVYLRRYKSDLKKSLPTLFTSIINNNEFPDTKFTIKGNNIYINELKIKNIIGISYKQVKLFTGRCFSIDIINS